MVKWICEQLSKLQLPHQVLKDDWPLDLPSCTDIWIVGGDGTLNYFINRYKNTSIPISIFKGGSGNDFAWKLVGDKTLEACFKSALDADPKPIDGGICNGRYFLNGVGIGFDGEIVKSMGTKKYISAGYVAYLIAVIRKIIFFKEPKLQLTTGSLMWNEKAFMATIANGSR